MPKDSLASICFILWVKLELIEKENRIVNLVGSLNYLLYLQIIILFLSFNIILQAFYIYSK